MKTNKVAAPKVTQDWVRKISAARLVVQVASAEAQEAQAKFNTILARAFESVGVGLEGNFICLGCGTIRGDEKSACQTCYPQSKLQVVPNTPAESKASS